MNVTIKRVYLAAADDDGYRILVDRLWPRGLSKEAAHIDQWLKSVAPSTDLRRWFGHDPQRWEEFRRRYRAELEADPEAVRTLRRAMEAHPWITLLFAAKDTSRNNAVVLAAYLDRGRRRRPNPLNDPVDSGGES